jgi:hypothetical protein
MESVLSAISAAPNKNPLRIFLYGQEGVGKTTWAARIPGALFLSCEDGSGDMEIPTIKIETWGQLLETVDGLIQSGVGAYRAVVLDTVSSFERLCWEHLLIESKDSSIESAGFGKSYTMAAEEVARLLVKLSQLRERRQVHIVLLGHALFRAFNDPNGPSYDLWQPAMHEKASALYMRWADVLLFAAFEATVKVAKRNKEKEATATEKGKATSVSRVLYTTRDAAYLAKNRYSLPEELPLSWDALAKAIRWTQRERAFNPLCCLQDAFAARVAEVAPGATPEMISAAETLIMRGKSFAALTFGAARDARTKIETMSAEDFAKIVAPALKAAPVADAAAAATAAAPVVADAAETAELEQHSAYEAVRKAFVARCSKINGEDPGEEELATASAEVKLGGPWARNDVAANKMLIGKWASMSDEAFSAMISPFITTLGF